MKKKNIETILVSSQENGLWSYLVSTQTGEMVSFL